MFSSKPILKMSEISTSVANIVVEETFYGLTIINRVILWTVGLIVLVQEYDLQKHKYPALLCER